MSIILANQNTGGSYDAFVERGYSQFKPTRASDLTIAAIPTVFYPHASVMMNNLGAVIHSQTTGRPVFDVTNFFPVLHHVPILDIFTRPVVMVRLQKDQADAARGIGLDEIKGLQNIWGGSPSWANFRSLLGLGPEYTRTGPGCVQYDAYMAFFYAIRLAVGFSAMSPCQVFLESNIRVRQADLKRVGDGTAVTYNYLVTNGGFDSVEGPMDIAKDSCNMISTTDLLPLCTPLSKTGVVTPNVFGQQFKKAPVDKGLFFHYFRGMLDADPVYMTQTIQRLFFRLLGKDFEGASEIMVNLRNGIRALVHHDGGEELTHLFIGINLAEQAQAMIQIVEIKGKYAGFVLVGDFSIILRGKKIATRSWKEVVADIDSLRMHDKSLAEIKSVVTSIKLADGSDKYVFEWEAVKCGRDLKKIFLRMDLNDLTPDHKKLIVRKIDDLDFGTPTYASSAWRNVQLFLQYVESGDETKIDGFDWFVGDGQIFQQGKIAVGLSIFGSLPPSVNLGRGKDVQRFQIPLQDGAIDENLTLKDGKRVLQYLPVKRKIISEAIVDWNKLLSTGLLSLPKGNDKRKEFVDANFRESVYGGTEFLAAYNDIKRVCKIIGSVRADDGKKRKANDVGEGAASKKGKASQTAAKKLGGAMME